MATAPRTITATTAIKNILFTTDFSAASTRALPYALEIARQHDATVHFAHVIKPAANYINPESGLPPGNHAEQEIRNLARRELDAFMSAELIKGIKCSSTIRDGALWKCVSALLRECAIDLVVLGTKGAAGMSRIVLGSDAEEIFRGAPCPVMTVGPHVIPDGRGRFKEILFALDFTDPSLKAYPHALEFTTEANGNLTVLHVVLPAPVEFGTWGMDEYKELMRRAAILEVRKATDYARHPVRPHVMVACGDPARMIVQHAQQLAADLIVMGVRHRTRVATHLPWTTAHHVVAEAPCPVLTVRS